MITKPDPKFLILVSDTALKIDMLSLQNQVLDENLGELKAQAAAISASMRTFREQLSTALNAKLEADAAAKAKELAEKEAAKQAAEEAKAQALAEKEAAKQAAAEAKAQALAE